MKTGVFAFDACCAAVRYYVALKTWSRLIKKRARQAVDTIAAHVSGSKKVFYYRRGPTKGPAALRNIEPALGVLTGCAQLA
jgi:hypothetical protein